VSPSPPFPLDSLSPNNVEIIANKLLKLKLDIRQEHIAKVGLWTVIHSHGEI